MKHYYIARRHAENSEVLEEVVFQHGDLQGIYAYIAASPWLTTVTSHVVYKKGIYEGCRYDGRLRERAQRQLNALREFLAGRPLDTETRTDLLYWGIV